MSTSIIAALMSIISSPDICEVSTTYRGRVSTFCANHGAALYQAARVETPTLRLPILHYCACRWDYHSLMSQLDADNKADLKQTLYHDYIVEITNTVNGKRAQLRPVDWGPARWTGRVIDIDSVSMRELDLQTDDEVVVRLVKRSSCQR